jgi:hypothetical protein
MRAVARSIATAVLAALPSVAAQGALSQPGLLSCLMGDGDPR